MSQNQAAGRLPAAQVWESGLLLLKYETNARAALRVVPT